MKQKKRVIFYIIIVLLLGAALAAGCYLHGQPQDRKEADQTQVPPHAEASEVPETCAPLSEDAAPSEQEPPAQEAQEALSCTDAPLETEDDPRDPTGQRDNEAAHSDASDASPEKPLCPQPLPTKVLWTDEAKAFEGCPAEGSGQASPGTPVSADALKRQKVLISAQRAREEGRLAEALALAKESGLQPELVGEIQQQIADENDRKLIDQAWEAMEALAPRRAMDILSGLSDDSLRKDTAAAMTDARNKKLSDLRAEYADRLLAGAWYSLALGSEPLLTGDRRYDDLKAVFSSEDRVIGGPFSMIRLTDGRVELLGDTLGAVDIADRITDARDAALGLNHGLVLHDDGTVTHLGARQYGRGAAEEWTRITKVAAGAFHSVGLMDDGTVAAAGLNLDGQCQVGEWTDVISVSAGLRHTVALLKDGRVVAAGDNSFGQCDVAGWENVVEIRCGGNFTVGLTADRRLLAAGDNGCGQCDVADWREVIAFDTGLWHTVALLSDGTVVTAGANGHDQCALEGTTLFPAEEQEPRTAPAHPAETELVYVGNQWDGPWFYCSGEGSVVIAFDVDTGKIKATRADLICTYGHPPVGIFSGGGEKPGELLSASRLAKQNKAVFALTGDYFTFGYNADGLQIRRGHVFKEEKDEVDFGFFPDRY